MIVELAQAISKVALFVFILLQGLPMGSVAPATGGGGGTITISSSNCAGSLDAGNTSITTINSTGAGAALVGVSFYEAAVITSVTDNKGNTWVPATLYASGASTATRFYLATLSGGTRGTSHVITVTTGGGFPSSCTAAITGATQYGAGESGTSTASTTSASSGSFTPTGANFLVCSTVSLWTPAVSSLAPTSPILSIGAVSYSNGNNLGVGFGCYQQSGGPTAINANWTWTTAVDATVNVVSVKP